MVYRIYVEKKPGFDVEANGLKNELTSLLGCWPLTGAIESEADTIEKIVEEMMTTTKSERTTRVIDFDQEASMEQKKREGYF